VDARANALPVDGCPGSDHTQGRRAQRCQRQRLNRGPEDSAAANLPNPKRVARHSSSGRCSAGTARRARRAREQESRIQLKAILSNILRIN
jgi:hypothetical protein